MRLAGHQDAVERFLRSAQSLQPVVALSCMWGSNNLILLTLFRRHMGNEGTREPFCQGIHSSYISTSSGRCPDQELPARGNLRTFCPPASGAGIAIQFSSRCGRFRRSLPCVELTELDVNSNHSVGGVDGQRGGLGKLPQNPRASVQKAALRRVARASCSRLQRSFAPTRRWRGLDVIFHRTLRIAHFERRLQ